MSTENKSRLRKLITIQEMDIPLSHLIDLLEFSRDRRDGIKKEVDLLKTALKSEYVERQLFATTKGLRMAIKEAEYEQGYWDILSIRLDNILHKALNE